MGLYIYTQLCKQTDLDLIKHERVRMHMNGYVTLWLTPDVWKPHVEVIQTHRHNTLWEMSSKNFFSDG